MPNRSTPPDNSYLPRLPGMDPAAQRVIQDMWTAMRASVKQTQDLINRPTWTKAQLDSQYSPEAIRAALSYGGSAQLNVNGLPGTLLQPQNSTVTTVTTTPGSSSPLNQTGTIISLNGQLMVYDGSNWTILPVLGTLIQCVHADRVNYPPASYALGVILHETDRGLYYENTLVGGVNAWVVTDFGYATVAQASLAAFVSAAPALGANDTGLRVWVSDFAHWLMWSGAAWAWGAGETGANPTVVMFQAPDLTTAWQVCDGSTVTYLKADGTTGSYTTPISAGEYFRR